MITTSDAIVARMTGQDLNRLNDRLPPWARKRTEDWKVFVDGEWLWGLASEEQPERLAAQFE